MSRIDLHLPDIRIQSVQGETMQMPPQRILPEQQVVELTVDPAVWREQACQNAGRDLTQEEWDLLVPGGGDVQSACP